MKKAALLLIGIIPFFIGFGMNYLMYHMTLPYTLIGIAFLVAWFLVGRYSCKLVDTKKEAIILGNSIAFIVLLLIIFQEYVLGQYWLNFVGAATQLYYLPFIYLGFTFTGMFHTVPPAYIAAFLMMCIVFCLGCFTNKNFRQVENLT